MTKHTNTLLFRFRAPTKRARESLYRDTNQGGLVVDGGFGLSPGEVLSLDSYFNAFFAGWYARFMPLDALCLTIEIKGQVQISVRHRSRSGETLTVGRVKGGQVGVRSTLSLPLPKLSETKDLGRIFLEARCEQEPARVIEANLTTTKPPLRVVSLAVVICTYQRPAEARSTVKALLDDPDLRERSLSVLVVDNDQTIDAADYPDPRIRVVPNPNYGGSAGFSRGLLEAMGAGATHVLFMDDDAEVDPESVLRLYGLFAHARQRLAVAGGMLSPTSPARLQEAGGTWDLGSWPRRFLSHSAGLELDTTKSLDQLMTHPRANCGGFWFFAFETEASSRIGLPLPLFLGGDDREFGIRLDTRDGCAILAVPGFAVWHEMLVRSEQLLGRLGYYRRRNAAIIRAIHGSNALGSLRLVREVLRAVLKFDYVSARLHLRAWEDFLHGPSWLATENPLALHRQVSALAERIGVRPASEAELSKAAASPRPGRLLKGVKLLSLNGHLLPAKWLSSEPRTVPQGHSWAAQFGAHQVVHVFPTRRLAYETTLDRSQAFQIVKELARLLWRSRGRPRTVTAAWKREWGTLASRAFWAHLLGLTRREPHSKKPTPGPP